eukprot:1247864-Prymnesium_polylepis.1
MALGHQEEFPYHDIRAQIVVWNSNRGQRAPDGARLGRCSDYTLCEHYSLPIYVQQFRMVMLAHLAPSTLSLQPILAVDQL